MLSHTATETRDLSELGHFRIEVEIKQQQQHRRNIKHFLLEHLLSLYPHLSFVAEKQDLYLVESFFFLPSSWHIHMLNTSYLLGLTTLSFFLCLLFGEASAAFCRGKGKLDKPLLIKQEKFYV